jgi:exopolysaccharide biosynthesis operon protein EpsL
MLSGVAMAMEGDIFRPTVAYAFGYDSNLFRLDSAAQSETYQRLGVGFDLDWKQGRQRVVSRVQASKTRFSRYSLLDNTGHDINLDWQWELGNQWSGRLGTSLNQSQGSYRDIQAIISNTRTNDSTFFEANYLIHPRWRASIRTNASTYSYSAAAQRSSNVEAVTSSIGSYYLGRSIERIGVEYRVTDGRFPDRVLTPTIDVAYQERAIELVADWAVSGKSRLNARIGQMQRQNTHIAGWNFSGLEWRINGTWAPTGKSLLGASIYRDVNNVEFATANHSVTDGLNLYYTWQVLPKTRLQASLGHENITYDTLGRQDQITTGALSAVYSAWTGGDVSAGWQHEARNSNAALLDYLSNSLFINANLKF